MRVVAQSGKKKVLCAARGQCYAESCANHMENEERRTVGIVVLVSRLYVQIRVWRGGAERGRETHNLRSRPTPVRLSPSPPRSRLMHAPPNPRNRRGQVNAWEANKWCNVRSDRREGMHAARKDSAKSRV